MTGGIGIPVPPARLICGRIQKASKKLSILEALYVFARLVTMDRGTISDVTFITTLVRGTVQSKIVGVYGGRQD